MIAQASLRNILFNKLCEAGLKSKIRIYFLNESRAGLTPLFCPMSRLNPDSRSSGSVEMHRFLMQQKLDGWQCFPELTFQP